MTPLTSRDIAATNHARDRDAARRLSIEAQASAKLLNAGITATACHCVGPQGGEPVCPCAMRSVRVVDGRYVRTVDLGPAPAGARGGLDLFNFPTSGAAPIADTKDKP